ncbi:MAG: BTAD domain-containing putative transcriptional regulator [Caldilineaceae bacterium]
MCFQRLSPQPAETGPRRRSDPTPHNWRTWPYDDNTAELNVRTLAGTGEVAAALLYFQRYRRRLQEDISLKSLIPACHERSDQPAG